MEKIESLLLRPKFYNNIDGVGEFGIGFMVLGCALLTWLQARSTSGAVWHKVYIVLPLIFVIVSIVDHGSKAIKKRITYPRTGFVEYKRRDSVWPAAIAFVVSALVAAGLALAARSHRNIGSLFGLATPAALLGLAFAAVYAYGFARAVRWKWAVVGVMAACSIAIAALPASALQALAGDASAIGRRSPGNVGAWLLSVLTYGTILSISGGISFWLYLRDTQPASRTAE